jgi:hypothetical protein
MMMMRNSQNRWQFFGLYAKVAGPQSIITNISNSRGYVTTFEDAMKRSLGYSKASAKHVERSARPPKPPNLQTCRKNQILSENRH